MLLLIIQQSMSSQILHDGGTSPKETKPCLIKNEVLMKSGKDRLNKYKKQAILNASDTNSRKPKPMQSNLLTSYYRPLSILSSDPSDPSRTCDGVLCSEETRDQQIAILQKLYEEKAAQKEDVLNKKWRLEGEILQAQNEADTYNRRLRNIMVENYHKVYANKRSQKVKPRKNLGLMKEEKYKYEFVEGYDFLKVREKLVEIDKVMGDLQRGISGSGDPNQRSVFEFRLKIIKKDKDKCTQDLQRLSEEKVAYIAAFNLAKLEEKSKFSLGNWPLIAERYITLELLGKGGFSEVYRCFDLQKCEEVAMKLSFPSESYSFASKQEYMKHIVREYKIQKQLKHPNIAALYQVIDMDDHWTVATVLEICSGPELSEFMKKTKYIPEQEAKFIIKQVLAALVYMADRKVIHYDLKPRNILFNNGEIKVVDFGLSKELNTDETKMQLTSQGVGTYWYLPPETFERNPKISSKVDVWSIGVIFYEMLFGKRPFGDGMSQNKILKEKVILHAYKVEFPCDPPSSVISPEAKAFIEKCLEYNQDDRWTVQQCYASPYISILDS